MKRFTELIVSAKISKDLVHYRRDGDAAWTLFDKQEAVQSPNYHDGFCVRDQR